MTNCSHHIFTIMLLTQDHIFIRTNVKLSLVLSVKKQCTLIRIYMEKNISVPRLTNGASLDSPLKPAQILVLRQILATQWFYFKNHVQKGSMHV